MFPTVDTEEITQVTSLNRNSSPHRNARDPPKTFPEAIQNSNQDLPFNMLVKEMVLCIALALTTYGALHSSPTINSEAPQAVRFFDYDSVVEDWYHGQLGDAMTSVNNAEISFVMYYAPWDAESQYVRGEFEKAAEVLGDLVQFLAINCWKPGSECRMQHNKIPSWPILMVYPLNAKGIMYRGPRDAHSMVKFLDLIMKPLERMSSTEDLVSLLSSCDAVAVGYTPMTDTSNYYNVWYQVALGALEFDVLGEICFAAVTSEDLALELGVDSMPSARLMLWNETKEYTADFETDPSAWNVSSLMNWILGNFTQPVARLIPMWKKAFTFEKYADGNPILMLFTPLNPLYKHLPTFSLLREVAMEYYDCKNDGSSHWSAELIKLQQVQRILYQKKDYVKFCQEYKFKKPVTKRKSYYKNELISRNNKYPWSNITQKTQRNGLFNFLEKRGQTISKVLENVDYNSELLGLGLLHDCTPPVLPAEKSYYDLYGQCQSHEDGVDSEYGLASTSMVPVEADPLAAENLIQENVKHFCKLTQFANERDPVIKVRRMEKENLIDVRGLACAGNSSLNIIAVDSVRNHHFAESLGIDIMNKMDMTAVVILDSKQETQYVLSGEYHAISLREFIRNYTSKTLKRTLRTRVDNAAHTHHFGSDGLSAPEGNYDSSVQVVDLTTKTFRKFIRTPGTLSIVCVCGGTCPAHATRAMLASARLLTLCGVPATAARLDALRHDLPWHYTVNTYPAILVFQAKRNEEPDSVSLPGTARLSAGSLTALALRSLAAHRRLRVRLQLCAHAHMSAEKKTCLKDLREHVTALISRNLKYWRIAAEQQLKQAFLRRLQDLHQVCLYLSLVHISDLHKINVKHQNLLDSLSILSHNWDIPFLSQNFTDSEIS